MEILKTELFPHQVDCIKYFQEHDKFLLNDGMGLGKTIESIACALSKPDIKHVLVISCVSGMQFAWRNEVTKFTYEGAFILGLRRQKKSGKEYISSVADRLQDLESKPAEKFWITNKDTLRNKDFKDAVHKMSLRGEITMCIIDEIHFLRNSKTATGKAIHAINCKYKIGLTGTPLMNNPLDLFNLLKWVGAEKHNYYQFERYYAIKGGFGGYEIVGYKHLDELKVKFSEVSLRRKKDLLELPPKIRTIEFVELSSEQKKLYNEVWKGIMDNVDKVRLLPNPLVELTRLRQVTVCPSIISSTITKSSKVERLMELLEEIIESGEKAVVFSNWSQVVSEVNSILTKNRFSTATITGDLPMKVRDEVMQDFQETENVSVLLGTTGAMGTGLTLTRAHTAIFLDEPWTYGALEQAEDRIYRIGTKTSVNIIYLQCPGTLDEKIHKIIIDKKELSDEIIDGKMTANTSRAIFDELVKGGL